MKPRLSAPSGVGSPVDRRQTSPAPAPPLRVAERFEPSQRQAATALAAIVLLAALLRLPTLDAQSLWSDETATWFQSSGSFLDIFARTARDNYPPLYNILAWLSTRLFGDAGWTLRLPAALIGVAGVAMIYPVAVRLGGRSAGLLAALMLCLSGWHVWYSQEARTYTLLSAAAIAHAWALLALLQSRRWPAAVLAVLSGLALVYTHPFGLLTWIALGAGAAWMLVAARDWAGLGRLAAISLLIALGFLPWAFVLLRRVERIADKGFWIADISVESVVAAVQLNTNALALPAILAACLPLLRRTRPVPAARPATPLLLAWTILPLAIAIAVSLLFEPILYPRYLIGSLPGLMILASLGLASCLRGPVGLLAAAGGVALLSVPGLLNPGAADRSDWRGAVAYVERTMSPDDCVTFSADFFSRPFSYYHRAPLACTLTIRDAAANPPDRPLFVIDVPQNDRQITSTAAAATERLTYEMVLTDEIEFTRATVRRFVPRQ